MVLRVIATISATLSGVVIAGAGRSLRCIYCDAAARAPETTEAA